MGGGATATYNQVSDPEVSPPFNAGQVFTPTVLADWAADILIEALNGKKMPTIIDPACGEGELLHAVKRSSTNSKVFGADIDEQVIATASKKFSAPSVFVAIDALVPEQGAKADVGWSKLPFPKQMDGVIANPPWGADILHTRAEVSNAGYSLAKGQYDSWDLFVELSLRLLKPNGVAAFIIPDSIFLPEHQKTRELLQKKSSILLIARLGEGIFKNVFRGTAVILVRKSKPKKGHKIEVYRLTNSWRTQVLSAGRTLTEARNELNHYIEQERFQKDQFSRWDIDISENERNIIGSISSFQGEWVKWLTTGRGVEMSKRGKVLVCPQCAMGRPVPRINTAFSCVSCGYLASKENFHIETIIESGSHTNKGWMPIVVGEDVDRYRISQNKNIRLNVEGINYKNPDVYSKRRMLIRKTGVGLKASICTDNCMTNQVVFHFYDNESLPPPKFYLSYVLGVFSSRVMFAYHLRKSGESEWRSHPYLTQKVISRLPIPLPVEGETSWSQAQAIAKEVDKVILNGEIAAVIDLRIEGLVAGLFKLNDDDMPWVKNVISSAQALEPMRTLQTLNLNKISPLHVS